jgi:hypothetical protein
MKVALNQHTLPFRTDCFVAGTQCRVSTNSPEILRAAAQWPTNGDASASLKMDIFVDDASNGSAVYSPHFRGIRHLVFVTLPTRNFVVYDLLRRRVHAVLCGAAVRDSSFWSKLFLPITIGVLGTTVGVVPLHCACLERNGAGFLLAGASGAGKSTLSAALAHLGFALISDDWTYIANRDSILAAHGLGAPIKLLPDAARFFPYLQNSAPQPTLNGELAYEVDPAHTGITAKNVSYPQRIFFLERITGPGCHFAACSPGRVKAYFQDSAERLPDELPEAKQFRASVLQSLSMYPAWILRTGEGPQKTAEAIDQFLTEAAYAIA